jgi:hypothetical protein
VLRPVVEPIERGRNRTLTPAFLAQVAQVARDARSQGVSTRRAVADRWDVSPYTARNWLSKISKAREEGHLGDEEK